MAAKKKSTAKKTAKKAAVKKTTTRKTATKKAGRKTVAKKTTVRKAVAKKTVAKKAKKKAAAKTATPALKAITVKQTKTQIVSAIAEETDLNRKQVSAVFGSLSNLVQRHMKKRGSGEFSIPETGVKIRRIRKPATKARKGINPFTGEPTVFKAKPARNQVKVTALKALKESVTK